jgi:hypothetical protein
MAAKKLCLVAERHVFGGEDGSYFMDAAGRHPRWNGEGLHYAELRTNLISRAPSVFHAERQ